MAQKTTDTTFNINLPSTNLEAGQKLVFKFKCESTSTNNFTASLGQGFSLGNTVVPIGIITVLSDYVYSRISPSSPCF